MQNIKNILNQEKGVYFGFALPESTAWDNFGDFWWCVGGETEATLWDDIDSFCGDTWDGGPTGTAGAHAVVIYGYNDDDPDTSNHYWLALNSWGNAGGARPNGLFRIPMYFDYDCSYPDPAAGHGWWAFSFETLNVDFGNALPIANANGPYTEDCQGVTTPVNLDGTGSFDLEGPLDFAWSTDCQGGSFDDASSDTPVLSVGTSPGCDVSCSVSLIVTDTGGATASASAPVNIADTNPPNITAPANVTIECNASTDPGNTGSATAVDDCDPDPAITYSDDATPGVCEGAQTIARTWIATDECGNTSESVQIISVLDTTPPIVTPPDEVTIECDEPTDPGNTGYATATDNCSTAVITYADEVTPGDCPEELTIARTWTATDACGNTSESIQTINVVDNTEPVISCNAPATITPPDAPISFTATATDNCDDVPDVEITSYDCYMFTKKGKRIDKTESCIVELAGDQITILDSGGVNDHISWTIEAVDNCGNASKSECELLVVNPAK